MLRLSLDVFDGNSCFSEQKPYRTYHTTNSFKKRGMHMGDKRDHTKIRMIVIFALLEIGVTSFALSIIAYF